MPRADRGTDPDWPLVLDAGALIAHERGRSVTAAIEGALRSGRGVVTSSGVVAQVWHGSPRQARIARLLRSGAVDERPLDADAARAVGVRCSRTGVTDVIDGHVAELALELDAMVLTSDPDDLVTLGVPDGRVLRI